MVPPSKPPLVPKKATFPGQNAPMTSRSDIPPRFGAKALLKAVESGLRRHVLMPVRTGLARLRRFGPRPVAMLGAYPTREAALAAVPRRWIATYDHQEVAAVNFRTMCAVRVWDYPVIFWLDRLNQTALLQSGLQRSGLRVLDAGGHFATKYIAFQPLLPLDQVAWTVYDLPETLRAARAAQARGEVPGAVNFSDQLTEADVLLASGLLQYLDLPFPDFLRRLPLAPGHIILNKVATREGASVTTLERIGPARVPYQIRNRAGFEAEIAASGYRILDQWDIPALGHVIDTHPDLGESTSRGYVLARTEPR